MDAVSFCVEDQSPGRKMRIHKHLNNDELIFIHKGEGTLTLDEELIKVKTGDVVFVPRGLLSVCSSQSHSLSLESCIAVSCDTVLNNGMSV